MNAQIKIIAILVVLLSIGVVWYFRNNTIVSKEYAFENKGLKTNTAKLSVPLDQILDGGPDKDGIPALNNPKFVSIQNAEKNIKDDINGIEVSVDDSVKFYPYSILVWHEVVNNVVGGKHLVVTFCPLCGSAIVFDTQDQFGVSGKIYESNLLMYDKQTESLWSQSIGTAVIGDRTREKLAIYPAQVVSFKTFKDKWPNGQVLSPDTGYNRDYSINPYGDYNNNDNIYFPVSVKDTRFPAKEIMYVVNAYDKSVAFPLKQLSGSTASVDVGGNKVTAVIVDGEIIVKDAIGKILPGYYEMWFSWATHHQKDGIVWKK